MLRTQRASVGGPLSRSVLDIFFYNWDLIFAFRFRHRYADV